VAEIIHARKINGIKGEFKFRIWSTLSDKYLTEEMPEKEIREWILESALCETVERCNREMDARVQRACTKGTSSRVASVQDLKSPWEK
jgi:hypothetical protein